MEVFKAVGWFWVLAGLAGCASAPRVTVLEPVGPPLGGNLPTPGTMGFLQVYSAREPAVTDLNAEEFFWNNDFGKNDFLHRAAHTDYDIYGQDGRLIEHVRNAQDINDGKPALVALPPGTYQVDARAEDYGSVTYMTLVPVVVKPGGLTAAHLDEESWKPLRGYDRADMVYLPNGQMAGWRAASVDVAHQPSPSEK